MGQTCWRQILTLHFPDVCGDRCWWLSAWPRSPGFVCWQPFHPLAVWPLTSWKTHLGQHNPHQTDWNTLDQNEDVPLVEFMYLVFTYMPSESYHRQLRSLLLVLMWHLSRANYLPCKLIFLLWPFLLRHLPSHFCYFPSHFCWDIPLHISETSPFTFLLSPFTFLRHLPSHFCWDISLHISETYPFTFLLSPFTFLLSPFTFLRHLPSHFCWDISLHISVISLHISAETSLFTFLLRHLPSHLYVNDPLTKDHTLKTTLAGFLRQSTVNIQSISLRLHAQTGLAGSDKWAGVVANVIGQCT